jgi:hypothetical protein
MEQRRRLPDNVFSTHKLLERMASEKALLRAAHLLLVLPPPLREARAFR